MLQYLKNEANIALTENGAVTPATTGSDCLDLFATVGAIRRECEKEIQERFKRAYAENRDIAMKLLFFARDVRGGLGERRVFRVILRWLANNEPDSLRKNLCYIAEYGRFDDLLVLFSTPCEKDMLALIKEQLSSDLRAVEAGESVSLLGKWLPSVNASSKSTVAMAKRIARYLGMTDAQYRKALVSLRAHIRIIENNLRERDYTFDYEKQPSKALFKYRFAFIRNDMERYSEFMNRVNRNEAKLNTRTLMPYEIISPILNGCHSVIEEERRSLDATWNSLLDHCNGENSICVVDGSGSMYGGYPQAPINVAISLGIYFAERNRGAFKNHFITFSQNPRLVEIKGEDIVDKVRYCMSFNEVANTNVQKVFELILRTAVKNRIQREELPRRVYIISDMEFDFCTENASLSNFEYAKSIFERAGYELPELVFWNVASRNRHQPVTKNEQGVTLVSGCTPNLFSMIAEGGESSLSPYAFMMEVLGGERYEKISA
ncbi:MAG: DUF2828 family protein [Ruminococcaceae bacterium]|nr:DUF2828 family protein [Oscillospiraceae bacterium]